MKWLFRERVVILQVQRLFQVLVNRFIASSPQRFVSDVLSELVDGNLYMWDMYCRFKKIKNFWFEDENDYIDFRAFSKDRLTPESFIVLFLNRKINTVIVIEEG